ncbi:uncharacterized protein LOC109720618 [Ananas comosus]|uniref:Uncharacterized protein LOC109720618 n=1 Tax=Ananas comosus TaxID=4615 RepID=A0A6P5G563_ANACO|nr:uncharacterized protein LOC109720618 [Ananas comosus]
MMTTMTMSTGRPPAITGIRETANSGLSGTTPSTYARRLSRLLELRGAVPVPFPTVVVEPTPSTLAAIRPYLLPGALDSFAAIAFTSRIGISSFALALEEAPPPPAPPLSGSKDEPLVIAALGKDAEVLREGDLLSKLCRSPSMVKILVPEIASPAELVNSLGDGFGRMVLCPVPTVVDLREPPVIPEFLNHLKAAGWVVVRVSAYETRWAGPGCVAEMVRTEIGDSPDAIVFTSSAEVEGLVKGLEAAGCDWGTMRRRWPEMLVAAHGPVTAEGVERFGIGVDVVGASFDSFDGVLDALALKFLDQK